MSRLQSDVCDFDIAKARQHLRLIEPDSTRFIFAAFPDRVDCSLRPFQRFCTLDQFARDVGPLQRDGAGIFVTVNAMKSGRRLRSEVARVRAVWADMDGPQSRPWPIAPTFVVQSSAAAVKCHVYFAVDPVDAPSVEQAEAINGAIVARHGADPKARDVARVLRLAGTWHLKSAPHFVDIVEQTGSRYSAQQLVAAFPPLERGDSRPPRPFAPPPSLHQIANLLLAVPADDYEIWLHVGMALHAETNGSVDGLQLWDGWSATSAKWRPGLCERKWSSFKASRNGNAITLGTLIHIARHHGWRPNHGGRHG